MSVEAKFRLRELWLSQPVGQLPWFQQVAVAPVRHAHLQSTANKAVWLLPWQQCISFGMCTLRGHEAGMSGGRARPDKCSSLLQVKGHRRITFDQFISALSHIAEKKQCQLGEVATAVLSNNGPAVSGTRADYVKLFDDKSTYTGGCVGGWSMAVAEPCVCALGACC